MTTRVIKKRIFTALSLMSWCVRNFLGSIYMYIVVSKVKNKNKRRKYILGLRQDSSRAPLVLQSGGHTTKRRKKKIQTTLLVWTFFVHIVACSWPVGITGIVGWVVSVEIISKVIFKKNKNIPHVSSPQLLLDARWWVYMKSTQKKVVSSI